MLRLSWKNATEAAMEGDWRHGITEQDLREVEPCILAAHETIRMQIKDGKLGYAKLPRHGSYAARVKELVRRLAPGTTDLVVLGIGGSALGNLALQAALNPSTYNLLPDRKAGSPRLFVLDNVDPALVDDALRFIGPRLATTIVNVISKSGETAETAGQFMILREMLRAKLGAGFAKRIVATTDPKRGTLHQIAKQDGYEMLEVPPDVGGRFTVLSQVGLFSAAMCGIDIDALLAGAEAMRQRAETLPWRQNPACMLAAISFLAATAKGKPIHVMMPYSNRLGGLADWYRQLWAESLGKRLDRAGREVFVGLTPIKALGATDQHSQIQLYREGPNDKLIVFLEVRKHPRDITVPDVFADAPGLSYLRRTKLSKLLNAEKAATEYALAESGRPSVTLRFNAITPPSVGEFIYLYEFTTSLMGELLEVNAYDQPAVELGKQATFALMGRPGSEELAAEIKPFTSPDPAYSA